MAVCHSQVGEADQLHLRDFDAVFTEAVDGAPFKRTPIEVTVAFQGSKVLVIGLCDIDGMPCMSGAWLDVKRFNWSRGGDRLEIEVKDGLLNPFGKKFNLVLSYDEDIRSWSLGVSWSSGFGLFLNLKTFEGLHLIHLKKSP